MRVKYLVGAVGFAVVAGLVVPGVSDASRGGGTTDPLVQPSVALVDEAPPDEAPVDEAPPTAPAVEEAPAAPAEDEAPPKPEADEPAEPVTDKPAPADETPAVEDVPTAPAVDEAPVVEVPVVTMAPTEAPAPAPAADKSKARGKPEKAEQQRGACDMDSYEPRQVASLDNGEAARAAKVDRNGNGTVCRKDIPGRGRGNSGEGSNIKDDQAR